jgi:hypothetical protein
MWYSESLTILMDPMGNDSSESGGMATTKKTILGNKKENFLGSLLDAIGEIRKTRPARLLACETTLPRAFVQAFGNIAQHSENPIDPQAAFFVCPCSMS